MRLRLTFAKTDAMRFTGHLDVYRTLYRTLVRARLPLAYSQGYTRRPKIVMAGALPLGYTGEREMADVWLETRVPLPRIAEALERVSSPGLRLVAVDEVEPLAPKVQNQVVSADYLVTLLESIPDLDAKIETLLAAERWPRARKSKTYDLRPLILELRRLDDEEGHQRLFMTLRAQEGATGRADEVVAALGGDPLAARYHRQNIHLD